MVAGGRSLASGRRDQRSGRYVQAVCPLANRQSLGQCLTYAAGAFGVKRAEYPSSAGGPGCPQVLVQIRVDEVRIVDCDPHVQKAALNEQLRKNLWLRDPAGRTR